MAIVAVHCCLQLILISIKKSMIESSLFQNLSLEQDSDVDGSERWMIVAAADLAFSFLVIVSMIARV